MKKRIVIVGSSFAGYTVAVTLAKLVNEKHDIIVIDKSPDFLFLPSFVWQPFGYRNMRDISFDTRPLFEELGITFIEALVYGYDLEDQFVYTQDKDIPYDYLVIATGSKPKFECVKGLSDADNAWSICSLDGAIETRSAWNRLTENPGPILVGATQWASYFFAAYEFVLNAVYHLNKKNLLDQVPVHFVTPEPYLGHFGIGGLYKDQTICQKLFKDYNIHTYTNAEMHEIKPNEVVLEDGQHIETVFNMIIPQFVGADSVKTTRKLSNARGFIKVTDEFKHRDFPNIYAAGGAVEVPQLEETPVPLGVPRTHSSSEVMAKAVAYNLATDIGDGGRISVSTERIYEFCRADMDYLGLMMYSKEDDERATLDYIAKGSQEKWANMTMQRYRETTVNDDYLRI